MNSWKWICTCTHTSSFLSHTIGVNPNLCSCTHEKDVYSYLYLQRDSHYNVLKFQVCTWYPKIRLLNNKADITGSIQAQIYLYLQMAHFKLKTNSFNMMARCNCNMDALEVSSISKMFLLMSMGTYLWCEYENKVMKKHRYLTFKCL